MNPALEVAAAVGLTFAVHSTLLLGGVWLIGRMLDARPGPDVWRLALLTVCLSSILSSLTDIGPAPRHALSDRWIDLPAVTRSSGGQARHIEFRRDGDQFVQRSFAADGTRLSTQSLAATPAPLALRIVGALWLAGVLFSLLRLGVAWHRQRRRLRSRRVVIGAAADRLQALARLAGLRRRVTLSTSADLDVAVALGRSEVCVPDRALDSLPGEWMDALLAHEARHLSRADSWWLVTMELARTLCWFQPLARMAMRAHRDAADEWCDRWAAEVTTPLATAQCLAAVAVWPMERLAPLAAGAGRQQHALLDRITWLLEPRPSSATTRRVAAVAAIALALAIAFFAPALRPASGAPALRLPVDPTVPVVVRY